jgi:exosome complex exonuclease DIS3/RRP44
VDPSHPYVNILLRVFTTRRMLQAVYFRSWTVSKGEYYHYGLAEGLYTHFTSPIRRYADIFVHRMLAAAIDWSSTHPDYLIKQYVEEVCDNINKRYRTAQRAGVPLPLCTQLFYFQDKVVEEEAYVIKVCNNAVVLIVPKYGIEGATFLRNKDHMAAGDTGMPPLLEYDSETQTLSYPSSGKCFSLEVRGG